MAVLEKIRVQMGIFITVLIAIALLSFIIDPNTLQSALSMFSSKNDVGEMNGQDITYMEYSKKLEYLTNLQQALTGTSSLDEQAQEAVAQGTWQAFMKELVYMPAMNKAGINLGNEEIFDMAQGREISNILLNDAIFRGEDGSFDRSRFATFVQNAAADPDGIVGQYWVFLQENMATDRIFSKYSSLLQKSNIITPVELRRNMEENNLTANVRFVLVPVSFARDSSITVSAQEIEKYYQDHKHLYKQAATRDIEYVVFPIEPSLKDLNDAQDDIEKVYTEFTTTDNLRQFLARNSDKPLDTYYYKPGELTSVSAVLDSFAFNAAIKDVLPVYKDGNLFRAARIASIKQLPDSVYVNHILIQRTSMVEANKVADSLLNVLAAAPQRFEELAAEFSADKNPNVGPGEIGWFVQKAFIPGMESVFEAPLNKPYLIETQYGVHIAKVTKRTEPQKKVQLAVLVKEAVAGKETYQTIYSQANTLATGSKDIQSFNEVAASNNWHPVPASGVAQSAKMISGYENMRELVRWAFDAKQGDVSQVISVENKYFFVAAVSGIHEEGVPTLAEKRAEIESLITMEKKMDKIYNQVKEELTAYNTLESWAEATQKTISTQNGLAFASTQQTDPKFAGAVTGAPDNTLCGPIKGEIGVYVFQVDERVDGAYYTEQDARQLATYMSNIQVQMVPSVLQQNAGVKDNRAKFF